MSNVSDVNLLEAIESLKNLKLGNEFYCQGSESVDYHVPYKVIYNKYM